MKIARLRISNHEGTALYKAVKRHIIGKVSKGEWRAGEMIPSEKKLCEYFGVSTGTIVKSLDELSEEGFLVREQGRGTFVAKHDQTRYLFSFFHIIRQGGHKEYPDVELLEAGHIDADVHAATMLGVATGSRLFRLVNRLKLGGTAIVIDEILLPETLFPGLTENELRERTTTLYQLYQDRFGVIVISIQERLRAVNADLVKAHQLDIKVGTPLLQIIRTALSFKDQVVELRYSYVVTDNYEYYSGLMRAS